MASIYDNYGMPERYGQPRARTKPRQDYIEGKLPNETPGPGISPDRDTPVPGVPVTPNPIDYGTALAGWDQGKWSDPNKQNPKYIAGRIFKGYNPSDWLDAAKQKEIVDKLIAMGLNPKIVDKDTVNFGSEVGDIDVLQNAGLGGTAWQWNPENTPTTPTGTLTSPTLLDATNLSLTNPSNQELMLRKLIAQLGLTKQVY